MDILTLMQKRYTAKLYNPEKLISQEKIEILKEVLYLCPSSINIQPWKFTFVQNPEIKNQLALASKHNHERVTQAPLLIVFSVADDLDAFQKVVDTELPEARRNWYHQIKANTTEIALKTWLSQQVYIALGVGLSACMSLELDSTPMEGIEADQYQTILKMTDYKPLFAMAVGYAAENDFNRLDVMPKSRRCKENIIETL